MPFTPLHMGPGALFKAALGGSFSLMVFGWAQILMDLQPLFGLLRGAERLHGISHTWLGAALLMVVAAASGRSLAGFGLRWLDLARFQPVSWRASWLGAALGTFSHIALDGVMHADMHPLAPWSDANALLMLVSIDTLHAFCIGSGALGAAAYFLLARCTGSAR